MLTLEQFKALRDQGLSTNHIIEIEKPVEATKQPEQGGIMRDLARPFIQAVGNIKKFPEFLQAGMIKDEDERKRALDELNKRPEFGVLPPQSLKEALGSSAELASYLPFGKAAQIGVGAGKLLMRGGKAIPTIKKAVKVGETAIPASIGGSLALGGRAAAEDKTPEQIQKQALIGGITGAVVAPVLSAGIGYTANKIQKKYFPTISEATQRYRDAFNIHKTDYNKIEVKQGKELDDVLQFSLEEGVIPSKSLDGKIQTKESVSMLRDKKREIDTKIAGVLDNKVPKHDLEAMRASAKKSISKTAQNADELDQMNKNIDNIIDAEINRYGRALVTDSELHTIKNGFWGIGFDINNRLKSPVGRRLGFFAKEMIQDSNPELNIQKMNQLSGTYQNAIDLLEGMHGRVVVGGRLGNWFSQGIGTFIVDRLIGNIPYVGKFGAFLGNYVGKHYNEFVHDPARIARDAVDMARKAKLDKRSKEVIDQFEKNIPKLKQRQFMEEFQTQTPSSKNLLPPGQTTPPQYMGKGEYIPGQPSTPSQAVIPTQASGILEGQSKLQAPVNRSFQESSGIKPVYPPVRSENRMLGPGNPNQSRINQGRSIQVLPPGSREYVGPETSIGKYSAPKKKELGKPPADVAQSLREAKGLSAQDIISKHPDINLKREVTATDIHGVKKIIPSGEALTPYELKGNKVLLQDGETYIVSKNQYQNIKGNAISGEARDFAPELKGTEETVKGSSNVNWQQLGDGTLKAVRNNDTYLLTKEGARYYTRKVGGSGPLGVGSGHRSLSEAKKFAEEFITDVPTKYSQYQLPGGKNYKEVLIKAPVEKPSGMSTAEYADKLRQGTFKSSHWDESNVISHLRLNERTYKGKKVTFMEELQSDWAREARAGKDVPQNPLLKNWQELSIKRALQEAVNDNAKWFAWINGEQTSARYNLATYLDKVEWKSGKNPLSYSDAEGKMIEIFPQSGRSTKQIIWVDNSGVIVDTETINWKGKKLDEVLGKGLADKIMEKESGKLTGEGLKFGGEWASNLYDKQVGNIVKDLTGVKVEVIDMGLPIDSKKSLNLATDSMVSKEVLTPNKIKIGQMFAGEDRNRYIITDILGDGKFKAVPKKVWEEKAHTATNAFNSHKEAFDISQKKTTQQGIRITPEIRAMVKGEAPTLKKPSGVLPYNAGTSKQKGRLPMGAK